MTYPTSAPESQPAATGLQQLLFEQLQREHHKNSKSTCRFNKQRDD